MDIFTEIGVGGSLAILVIREVLNFLKRNGEPGAGSRSVEFWQAEHRRAVKDVIEPFLETQTEILRDLEATNRQISNGIIELVTLARRKQ